MTKVNISGEAGQRTSWEATYTHVETQQRMLGWVTVHHPMMLPLMRCRRVLEVGTGTGMLSGFLAKAGVDVTTIDLSPSVLETGRRFHDELGVKVGSVEGNGMATPFEDDDFDAVFSQGLWEHFDDEHVRRLAREALRLAPVVYTSVPSVYYPRIGHHGVGVVGNERFMSAKRWRSILDPLGARASTRYYSDWKFLTILGVVLPYPIHLMIELRR